MNSCSVHCLCCRGLDGLDSRVLPVAAVLAGLGSAGCRATDGVAGPGDLKDGVKDSEPGPGTGLAGTDGASRDVVGGVDAGRRLGVDGVVDGDDGSAVASLAPGGGDAGRRTQVSSVP